MIYNKHSYWKVGPEFASSFAEKKKSSGGNHEPFLVNHSTYWAEDFKCNVIVHHPKPSTSTPGRPTKTIEDLNDYFTSKIGLSWKWV